MTAPVPPDLIVLETDHWIVNHRIDSRVAGYLMVGARAADAAHLWQVPPAGLAEVGRILADCSRVLTESCSARRVYVSRYGHDAGWPVHFHVIPVYEWVEAAYAARHGDAETPDGVELTRFIMREFCERRDVDSISAPQGGGTALRSETVRRLRESLR